jgi:hypothetical protein
MTHGPEFWLAYQFLSRGNTAPTTQLVELESPGYKLVDLEDVLEYGTLLSILFLLYRNNVDVQLLRLMMTMFTLMMKNCCERIFKSFDRVLLNLISVP